ncbi:hypothetical protein Q4491_01490 [Photobacterium sp. 2_MG-2023]|uniref:hypothetical protein n=1 Tax=Photobacterium TaxID=657 RepID=UPI0026E3EADB|nr:MULTISPECIES: hypothetical protein [Photobacterium]MDO6580001.1 hypothetical protein [Photobacterium sp. 2_MG-2023]
MCKLMTNKAAIIAAFCFYPSLAISQTEKPFDISCSLDGESVAIMMMSESGERVAYSLTSRSGNKMRSAVSGSSKSRMSLSKAQFPVSITVDATGETSQLIVTDDCQITTQTPHS